MHRWRVFLPFVATLAVVGVACGSGKSTHGPNHSSDTVPKPQSSPPGTPYTGTPIPYTESGIGARTTRVFDVGSSGSWDVNWSYTCPDNQGFFSASVDALGVDTPPHPDAIDPSVESPGGLMPNGAGIQHYVNDVGPKYLQVISPCQWSIAATPSP
jgi:hypothetical protein